MSPVRRPKHTTPAITLDAGNRVITVGGQCGLYVDLSPGHPAPAVGDWIATQAGSRYLVDHVRIVRRRRPTSVIRYQLRTLRLPKHTAAPDDVRVIWLDWYPRGRATR